jgi:hypothetical protein
MNFFFHASIPLVIATLKSMIHTSTKRLRKGLAFQQAPRNDMESLTKVNNASENRLFSNINDRSIYA